ncbi:MAG: MoaD/ThiS family protein [Candidatus Aureabacteria bacterium]|nr:MoaD/ThiS family protein [Candidatus Auribacterota bacterium]
MAMTITVSLFGEYRKYGRTAEFPMELPAGATPLTVAEALGIPRTPSLWALVDGKRESLDAPLREGSKVFFFQPVGGG